MTSEYDDSNIRVLKGVEAIRIRPGMYVGSTKQQGLHQLVFEVVNNSIEEAIAGYCGNIDVSINIDGTVTVIDDGRGIEEDRKVQTDKFSIEKIFTTLYPGRHQDYIYRVSGGLYGVGLVVISALSTRIEVKVWRDRNIYSQRFERGKAVSELEIVPSPEERMGTMITFLPDPEIFKESIAVADGKPFEFDYLTLANRLRELAYLNRGIRISICDNRSPAPKIDRYYYPNGISEYVALLDRDERALHEDVIYIRGERNRVKVEVALQWCDREEDCILGFANTVRTVDGGTHLEGFKQALTRTINDIAQQQKLIRAGSLKGEYIREGLSAIVSILLPNPEFEGATRTKLGNPEVRGIVDSIVSEGLHEYFTAHPDVAAIAIEQAIQAAITDEMRKKEGALLRRRLEDDRS